MSDHSPINDSESKLETFILSSNFSSAHFYENKSWTPEQNQEVFGLCYSKHGHGHNYELQVWVNLSKENCTDPGFMATCQSDLHKLTRHLEHKHLNFDIEIFKTVIPTTENILGYLVSEMKTKLPHLQIRQAILKESEHIWSEWKENV